MSQSRRRRQRKLQAPVVRTALQSLRAAVSWLPYRVLAPLAATLGRMMSLHPGVRKRMTANLAVAFPQWDPSRREQVRRDSCRHAMLTGLEVLWFNTHPDQLSACVDASDPVLQQAMTAVIEGQCSCMFITPHLGNWEAAGQSLAALGVPLNAVARRIRAPWPADIITDIRNRFGIKLIEQKGAVRGMVQALRKHEAVGILMDQTVRPQRGGLFVDFFGLPACTTRAPASLLRKCGGRVCCVACVREDQQRLRLHAVSLPRPVESYTSDQELTQALLKLNEDLIRRWPQQYMWNYERWRYLPPEESEPQRFPYYAKAYKP